MEEKTVNDFYSEPTGFKKWLGLALMGVGGGLSGKDTLGTYAAIRQNQAELAFKKWQQQQIIDNGVPVYTFAPDGSMVMAGSVPKGSKVVPPSSMQTPDQKSESQAKTQALKETQLNLSKVKRLNPIVDTIEKEWLKVKPQSGVGGRLAGVGKVVASPFQTNKNVSSYLKFVKGMRAQLARAMGDVGNLSEPEQKAAMDLVPSVADNYDVGVEKLKKIRLFIGNLEQGNIEAVKGLLGDSKNKTNEDTQSFNVGGKVYNIPYDKIEAFKQAKGIK